MGRLFFLLFGTLMFASQAPVDTTFFTVAYVEIMSSSKAAAVAALKQYRDASRKDEGFQRMEIFEQIGWPGHFSIIEAWRDQKSFDAHRTAAHTMQMLARLESIRTSDYDQRPYKTLTVAAPRGAASDRAIYVITHVDIAGQQTSGPVLLRQMAETSRNEEGNSRLDVLQHMMRANHFTVIEAWESQTTLDAHAAAAHTRQFRAGIGPITGSPLDQRIYRVVE
jgi:quinol monooxygenase YgiN